MDWGSGSWLVLLILFLVAEAATVSVVSLWFAFGALAAMIASALGAKLWLQVAVFLVVSCTALLAMRPIVKKHLKPRQVKTNVDAMIGSQGIVTAQIDNRLSCGQVKLGAMEWTARSTSGDVIPEGAQIKVDRIEGVKVFVTPVETPVNVKQEV